MDTANKTPLTQLSCTALKGVGPRLAERLAKCGVHTLHDLLLHLPSHYQDRTRITPIRHINIGDFAVIEGVVASANVQFGKRRTLVCRIVDPTGVITLRFFYFNATQQKQLSPGQRIKCFGQVKWYQSLEMVHPEYRALDDDTLIAVDEHLTAVYPTTEQFHQTQWRKLIRQALPLLQQSPLPDFLPAAILQEQGLPPINEALQFIHQPPPEADRQALENKQHPAQRRLAFEELVAHQLSLKSLRLAKQLDTAPAFASANTLIAPFLTALPFSLTNAQQRAYDRIKTDLSKPHPMLRLLQGDVGSGKTVVATLALLHAVSAEWQGALMAPTEILAEQHYQTLSAWLTPLGIHVTLLTSHLKAAAKKQALADIETGKSNIIVGTHALFQAHVVFHRLGLMIIDEQHRFGVHQRLLLQQKSVKDICPHQLTMTATPIPRTLMMACYADLDNTIIDELPPGRQAINTVVVGNQRRDDIIARIESVCEAKQQVYWVCSLIETSEHLICEAAEVTEETLKKALPQLNIALVHGRMKSIEKEAIMQAFKQGVIQLLVATTVIEVGVDVPNASLMVIENAERLGLSQLHQLRGRVGRGSASSHCVLLYQAPLSPIAKKRLEIMRTTQDGFKISEEDLTMRGPGELLGTRQTGDMQFRIADLERDQGLLESVQAVADDLLQHHPETVKQLMQAWLGEKLEYHAV